MRSLATTGCVLFVFGLISYVGAQSLPGNCSYHQFHTCDLLANCTEYLNGTIDCICPDGADGDGLRDGTGCGRPTCTDKTTDCHPQAICTAHHVCVCEAGYTGDGSLTDDGCVDIDECLDSPCMPNAICSNHPGSYECTCNGTARYERVGDTCQQYCTEHHHCATNQKCEGFVCVCDPGFERISDDLCIDIDECEDDPCHGKAICTNTIGSFNCKCKGGFFGSGFTCTRTPKTCHEIKLANPGAKTKEYLIDIDGPGPLPAITVFCEMQLVFGITVIHTTSLAVRFRNVATFHSYTYQHTFEQIKELIDVSGFCSQTVRAECRYKAALMDGDDYWIDGNNGKQNNWGGAPSTGHCACGEVGNCVSQAAKCNCDGVGNPKRIDFGKIIDKSILPIRAINIRPGRGSVWAEVGAIKCGPDLFDIPRDCDEAKFEFGVKENGPQWLDVDGPGPHPPFIAECDVKSYYHAGITLFHHTRRSAFEPFGPGIPNLLAYYNNVTDMTALVNISFFCMQEASYTCMNSSLMNKGNMAGYYTDIYGNIIPYWPGGMGVDYMCACGLTGRCASQDVDCNCDILDGEERKDFGIVIDKNDLPIGAFTFHEVGPGRYGSYAAGPLKCSQKEFGIPPTCEGYMARGYTEDNTYFIDPDGFSHKWSITTEIFPVFCEFYFNPDYAVTVLPTFKNELVETATTVSTWYYYYRHVSIIQLTVLIQRVVSCTQTVSYKCSNAPIHSGMSTLVTWSTKDNRTMTYYAGTGWDSICPCGLVHGCVNNGTCNCDANDTMQREDEWFLTNKFDLPVMSIDIADIDGYADISVGPLRCNDLFPNCHDKKTFNRRKRIEDEPLMRDGYHAIDPDGPGGVPPFKAHCKGWTTIIYIDRDPTTNTDSHPGISVKSCYNITYAVDEWIVTPAQIQSLADNSAFCRQTLKMVCLNAPITNHVSYSTCAGEKQTGWAALGKDMCTCGVTGGCAGGPDAKCNCDTVDGETRSDGGEIYDTRFIPVCGICVELDDPYNITTDPQMRTATTFVSELVCSQGRLGGESSCQRARESGLTESKTVMLDPDRGGWRESFPVYCEITHFPAVAYSVIRTKMRHTPVPEGGFDIIIEYFGYSFSLIKLLIRRSRYCFQDLYVECDNSSFHLNYTNGEGWYDSNGFVQTYWAGGREGQFGCAGVSCNCNLGGVQFDGGSITNKMVLPITRVKVGAADGFRNITVGDVYCYDLYPHCHAIKKARANRNPHGNHVYAIDPDQNAVTDYLTVTCDFTTDKYIGITVIETSHKYQWSINQPQPGGEPYQVVYKYSVTYEQIHSLTIISSYCYQRIHASCFWTSLIENNTHYGYYTTFGGNMSTSFGVSGHSDFVGCPCKFLNTCPGSSCHCDASEELMWDYGYETDNNVLPIQTINIGGTMGPNSKVAYRITPLKCGPRPFDLPKNCDQVRERGLKTGEHLIQPHSSVSPFMVYCSIDKIVKGRGVTIIKTKQFEAGWNITWDYYYNLTYYGATYLQVTKLVEASEFCYFPIKYTCRNTRLKSFFSWYGKDADWEDVELENMGAGRPGLFECNCGYQGLCGGSENKTALFNLQRECNCEAEDSELRADSGIYTSHLPMSKLRFLDPGLPGAFGHLQLGALYCSEVEIDFDECKLGWNDCHPMAKCRNTPESYTCQCKRGWRGLGTPYWANGRNCYDDDECALNYCPWSANCTNLPGSYKCDCMSGFEQTGSRKCKDINECEADPSPCDENAWCTNTQGEYICSCKTGFRGDGKTCMPVAGCKCHGDPHCNSFDNKPLHFQGTCQYVMATNNCTNNSFAAFFEVLSVFYSRDLPLNAKASWVKEAFVNINNNSIFLGQNGVILFNGYNKIPPFYKQDISIERHGKYVEVKAGAIGLEVRWDGKEILEVLVPGQWGGKVCGLCGNYNGDPNDDWVTGPVCPSPNMSAVQDAYEFGNSWAVEEYVYTHVDECAVNCSAGTGEPDHCTGENRTYAEDICKKVFSRHSRFQACLRVMELNDPDSVTFLEESCVIDVCSVGGDAAIVVCPAAEALVDHCRNDLKIELPSFRSPEFCDNDDCLENQVYYYCGPLVQISCYHVLNDITPAPQASCTEGCFCPDGLVEDNNRCVNESDCGCMHQGTYYSVGETVEKGECQEIGICLSNHTFNFTSVECKANSTCDLKNGVKTCHCDEGFFGDGTVECKPDPCDPSPCNPEETCEHAFETERKYICICAPGYTGECDNCEDINECLTGTHKCPEKTRCINYPGSYGCECKEGFILFGGQCEDIDECNLNSPEPMCGEHSRCINELGSYDCPCCQGYEKHANGTCVVSESEPEPNQPHCCTCTFPGCEAEGAVCGEDGETYNSLKDMIITKCEEGLHAKDWIKVDYFSSCKGSCANVQCPKYQTCKQDDGEPPHCECIPCTPEEQLQTEPVCTTQRIRYENKCVFLDEMCKYDLEVEVELFPDFVPCEGSGGQSPVGPWSLPGPCSVTCGIGTKTRTRQPLRVLTHHEQNRWPLEKSAPCYNDPCPDGACFGFPCPNIAHVCNVNETGDAECVCPEVDHLDDSEVCGYITSETGSSIPQTWKNLGQLMNHACTNDADDFTVMHEGECGDEPLYCTRLPHFGFVNTTVAGINCTSTQEIPWYSCDGSCGEVKELCCHPVPESVHVELDCAGDIDVHLVPMTDHCECVDVEIVEGGV